MKACLYGCLILVGSLLFVSFHVFLSSPVQAQNVTQARVTEILDGNQVFIQDRQARVNSVARQQQRVRTGASRASLSFNTGAVARLAQNSSLTVGQCAQLQRGTVLVNGRLNGCTGSTVAGVRGTIYTLSIDEEGLETLKVYEGSIDVSRTTNTATSSERPQPEPIRGLWGRNRLPQAVTKEDSLGNSEETFFLEEGQSLTYNPTSRSSLVEELTPEDFERLLDGPFVNGFTEDLPDFRKLRNVFERLFPDLPFPLPSVQRPSIPTPPLPTPSVPLRVPF